MVRVRDRIKELRRVPASELIPHSKNWRRHPKAQRGKDEAELAHLYPNGGGPLSLNSLQLLHAAKKSGARIIGNFPNDNWEPPK